MVRGQRDLVSYIRSCVLPVFRLTASIASLVLSLEYPISNNVWAAGVAIGSCDTFVAAIITQEKNVLSKLCVKGSSY